MATDSQTGSLNWRDRSRSDGLRQTLPPNSIFFLLGLALLVRLYNIQSPIIGVHSWRQADTAALARNFAENGLNFFYPQVDWAGSSAGYAETEFPLYSYLVALLYKLFGVSEIYGRAIAVVCSLVALFFLFQLVAYVVNRQAAFWASFFYAVLPLNVFYSRTFQPESMMQMACVMGLYFFIRWLDSERWWHWTVSALFVAIACLLKVLPLAYLGLPLLYLAAVKFKGKLFQQVALWVYAGFILGVTAAWYYHAHQIYLTYGHTFGFWGGTTDRYLWTMLLSLKFWGDILLRLAVRHFAVVGFFLFLGGLWVRRRSAVEGCFDMGLIGVVVSIAIAPTSSYVHEYYQLPFVFYGVIFIGKACDVLLQSGKQWQRQTLAVAIGLTLVSGSVIYSLDYMRREVVHTSEVYALAQQVKASTPQKALLVSATGGDPTLLYLSHRKGWLVHPDDISAVQLEALATHGADYLAGSYSTVESYTPFTNSAQKQAIQTLIDNRYRPIINTDRFYIAAISPAE
ncbi:ArnT family glycosyltransferase [Sphaerothrix gracilis]|uniref:ArnT family glycosyltransferase n=1 Tax=Sphaerothrix gracilis TaxID=3151835 RepID=UPI0031FC0F0A